MSRIKELKEKIVGIESYINISINIFILVNLRKFYKIIFLIGINIKL